MKELKKVLSFIISMIMIFTFAACKNGEKSPIINKMSTNFVFAESVGIKQGGTDNYEAIQKLLDEGKSIYLGDGEYHISKTLKLKNAQLIGTATTKTHLIANGDFSLIEADGQFVISDMTMSNSTVTGEEKQGEKALISLGKNGGVTEGSFIKCVRFNVCGTSIYEDADATPSKGLTIDTVECTRVIYAGLDFQSKGRLNNCISNIYMRAKGDDVATVGGRFCGSEKNLKIDQFNVEHFIADNSLYFDGVENLDISTVHIEGMDIGKESGSYFHFNNTSGNLGNLVVYWSRVSNNNCSAIKLGDAAKSGSELFIESLQLRGINDPNKGHYGEWAERGRGTGHINWRVVDRIDGSQNEYRIEVDNYLPFTFQSDWELVSSFPCDEEEVIYIKKGNILQHGTTEERPVKCLCKGYSKYYDTTLGQLLIYNGSDWAPYIEADINIKAEN